ncbi:ParA family protein [Aetokthonos hydrillicola Thurmond2011]|jgi:chromosome partitioning protein|uniref:ParA family protein n=1 Tax=Aetokthonos hydrillicola Thurmond2011 TaxID=2712845 RepID=A0AAP5IEK9_9CYAN|nr:ParA family protein [Aetokthonos hydrillicola]MBW4589690.1 ParA family protein [Aetokthonos hydrillicola CCALA 1050]MDR9898944.1 ParA family protein [Aetokthonos hydrillicola Thurmond2011]
MAAKIIATFNQCGGAGKTTLTQNLGYHLSQLNRKVLVVDSDPQGTLTAFMGLKPTELQITLYDAVAKEEPLEIIPQIHGMDLVPANLKLSLAEADLVAATLGELRLKNSLEEVANKYEFILIDCPPSLGILSTMSLIAATHMLIPIPTEYKGLLSTELLLPTIVKLKKVNKKLAVAGFVPTMFDSRTNQSSKSLKGIEPLQQIGQIFPSIPKSTDFINASQENKPLALYNPRHPAVQILEDIAQRLDGLNG